MLLYAAMESGRKPFDGQLLNDISEAMAQASEEETQYLGPEVLSAWGDFEQLTVSGPLLFHCHVPLYAELVFRKLS